MPKNNNKPFTSEIWNDLSHFRNPNKWYHLNEIAKKSKNIPVIMEKHLDLAVKLDLLEKKGRERRIMYKLNPNNPKVKKMLKTLSIMETINK